MITRLPRIMIVKRASINKTMIRRAKEKLSLTHKNQSQVLQRQDPLRKPGSSDSIQMTWNQRVTNLSLHEMMPIRIRLAHSKGNNIRARWNKYKRAWCQRRANFRVRQRGMSLEKQRRCQTVPQLSLRISSAIVLSHLTPRAKNSSCPRSTNMSI